MQPSSAARHDDKYLTTDELAERWRVVPNTVITWRARNIGPPYFKAPGTNRALYRLREILELEDACRMGLTASLVEDTIKATPGIDPYLLDNVWDHFRTSMGWHIK